MILTQEASSLAEVHEAVKIAAQKFDYESWRYLTEIRNAVKAAGAGAGTGADVGAGPELPRGTNTPVIWFRGQRQSSWDLEPILLRKQKKDGDPFSDDKWTPGYSQARLQENYRLQYFSARAYHLVAEKPDNNIEWQEILQHYQVSTRLMDWSESLYAALLFALESFIADPGDDTFKVKRISASPTVWLFYPALSNAKLYDMIVNDPSVIKESVDVLLARAPEREKEQMTAKITGYMKDNRDAVLDARGFRGSNLVSLSRLAELRASAGADLLQMLTSGEFNPFFYLLLRIYNDGIALENDLPPVAMIHPYHSPRIAIQNGAFTVFPFPKNKAGARVTPLNKFPGWDNCLCEIRLTDPQAIADEMAYNGFSREDLYPELETYGKETERRQTSSYL